MNKLIRIVTGIIILVIVIIKLLPDFENRIENEKENINDIINQIKIKPVIEYINKNKNNMYLYEGATYCIKSNLLESIEVDSSYIVEVVYSNKEFKYRLNNKCKEK